MEKSDFEESVENFIKNYIRENLTVEVDTELDYDRKPSSVEVSLRLDGEKISVDRDSF